MLRKLKLLAVLMLVALPARANTLAVVNTAPTGGTTNVALTTTISFTFNHSVDLYQISESFLVAPENAVDISNVAVSDDGRLVTFEVVHEANTDYTWIISGMHEDGATGEQLMIEPFVLTYTTSTSIGMANVRGRIDVVDNARRGIMYPRLSPSRNSLPADAPILKQMQKSAQERVRDGTPTSGHGVPTSSLIEPDPTGTVVVLSTVNPISSGEEDGLAGATVVNGISGEYNIPYLRPGTYYPYAMRVGDIPDGTPIGDLFGSMFFGFYDPNGDGEPDVIMVPEGGAVENIDFSVAPLSYYAETAAQSEITAREAAAPYAPDQILVGINAFGIGHGGGSAVWEYNFYSPSTDMQTDVSVSPFDVSVVAMEYTGEAPPEAVPATYVDSDHLLLIGLLNGGEVFLQRNPQTLIGMTAGIALDNSMGEGPSGAEGPYWAVAFVSISLARLDYLIVYVDMESGDVIDVETSQPAAGKYSDRLEEAYKEVSELDGSFVLVSAYADNVTLDGVAGAWQYEFYASNTDTWATILVEDGHSVIETESPVGQPEIKPLGGIIIDSDVAVSAAMAQGGSDFAEEHPVNRIEVFAGDVAWMYPSIENPSYLITLYGSDEAVWFRAVLFPSTGLLIHSDRSDATGGEPEPEIPTSIALDQNFPNPFNPQTTIPFRLASAGTARLTVHDALGREVAVLLEGSMPQGEHQITWDAADMPSGVYFYRLVSSGQVETGKMLLQK